MQSWAWQSDVSADLDFYQPSVELILNAQQLDGSILCDPEEKLDVWDMVEAAMGLAVAGEIEASQKAYQWLAEQQLEDGSFWSAYQSGRPICERREPHHAGYLAVGLWHLRQVTGDDVWWRQYWPHAVRALDFVLSVQTPEGDIAWAVDADGRPKDDALLTACSNLCKSLECGIAGEQLLGRVRPDWQRALDRLRTAIRYKPWRFDRHWESKERYSMDWFYPILCGLYTGQEGVHRLQKRWHAFVQPELGCRCVSDSPWVTVAESSELVMTLCGLGQYELAAKIFGWLHQHRDDTGCYWMGYVWPDRVFWPEERPSWTAGAVLLAADGLYQWTAAAHVLMRPVQANQMSG